VNNIKKSISKNRYAVVL